MSGGSLSPVSPAAFGDDWVEPNPWAVTTVVMIGMVMSIIDASIVNVALPHMMGSYGAGINEIAWVVTGYTLSNVIVIPLSAWLASLVGRARLYGLAVAVFTLMSVACGLAPSLLTLITARILQGVAAGLLMPLGQAILYESFPPEKRGASMAVFGLGIMVGPAIGPTLGGWLVDNMGWPWIFFINLPVGILATFLVPIFLHDPPYLERRKSARGDLVGVMLLAAGIGLSQYILEEGADDGWFQADWVVVATAASVLLLTAFVVWELDHDHPAVDLRIFADTNFRATIIINVIVGVGLMGGMFMLPLYMQRVMGLTATLTGIVLLPGAIATAVAMSTSGRLCDRGYARSQVALGLIVFGAAMFLMARLSAQAGMGDLLLPQILRGIGMGFTFVPLSVVAVYTIPRREMGQATGMINLTRRLGGSLGIAWLTNVLSDTRVARIHLLAGAVQPYRHVAQNQLQATAGLLAGLGLAPDAARDAAVLLTYQRVARAAADLAFQHVFLVLAALFIGSLPLLLLLRNARTESSEWRGKTNAGPKS